MSLMCLQVPFATSQMSLVQSFWSLHSALVRHLLVLPPPGLTSNVPTAAYAESLLSHGEPCSATARSGAPVPNASVVLTITAMPTLPVLVNEALIV